MTKAMLERLRELPQGTKLYVRLKRGGKEVYGRMKGIYSSKDGLENTLKMDRVFKPMGSSGDDFGEAEIDCQRIDAFLWHK